VLALAGSAFAYWTGASSGTGTGLAATGGTVTLTGTVASGIAPGLTRDVTFTGVNTSTAAVYVTRISFSTLSADVGHSGCVVTDFSMPDTTENSDVPVTGTNPPFSFPAVGHLTFADTTSNQDACKGATLTLVLSGS
jgi:hypothetical protein